MRIIRVVIALGLVACGDKHVSPFIDGPPPIESQQRFLAECGVPHDGRHPGAAIQYFVRSEYPDGPFHGTMCRVHLLWTGNTIDAVEVLVDNDRVWLDKFVRSAVLPLLKPQARAVVEREFLTYVSTTPVATEIHEAAVTAGEGCDPPDGTLCSPTCVFLGGRASSARASVSPREREAHRRAAVCTADPFADACQD